MKMVNRRYPSFNHMKHDDDLENMMKMMDTQKN